MIEHVARAAEAVPSSARTTAWLHDLLELTPTSALELRSRGVLAAECQALELVG